MVSTWVVSGAPLLDGSGWRFWYAKEGSGGFTPEKVTVYPASSDPTTAAPLAVTEQHKLYPPLEGMDRRIAIKEVRLPQPDPTVSYKIRIPELGIGIDKELTYRTLPSSIDDQGMSFIMASCYWYEDDKNGNYGKAVKAALKYENPKPAFKFLIGDQIYLDYPTAYDLRPGAYQLVADRYRKYWKDGAHREALLATPNFFLCDDHEYWNDYPEWQVHLPQTWGEGVRKEFGQAAEEYYRLFQRNLNPDEGKKAWIEFKIDPVSFFISDTRSERSLVGDPRPYLFSSDQWYAINAWQKELTGPGILVLGQPLFQKDGDWRDHSLSNFQQDYCKLMQLIENSLRGVNDEGRPHDILVLTGDIHAGRCASATIPNLPNGEVHEWVASPASRVGPFLSEPEAQAVPNAIKHPHHPTANPWSLANRTTFSTVENNIAVIRIRPSSLNGKAVLVEYVSYLVRPHHIPAWKFWAGEPDVNFNSQQDLILNKDKKMRLYLR